jgi:uncharacterized protein
MKIATQLYRAVTEGDVPAAQRLLDGGADPNAAAFGRTPLIRAVEKRQLGAAVLLLDRGADQSIRLHGATPLHIAATKGPGALVRALLDAGADPEARDGDGRTALMCAVAEGPIEAVRALLDHPVDLEAKQPGADLTALCFALLYPPRPTLVRLLLDRGADVRVRAGDRRWGRVSTPLSLALYAVRRGEESSSYLKSGPAGLRKARAVVQMLRDAGATE